MPLSIEKQKAVQKYTPIWVNIFKKLGVEDRIISYIIPQLILESDWFTSPVFLANNNPGGVTWNNWYTNRPGASKGSARPPREGGNYVKFDTLENAGKDIVRILSRKPGEPIKALTIDDYAVGLAKNGYYDQRLTKPENYTKTLKSIYNTLNQYVDVAALLKKKFELLSAISILPIFLLVWLFLKDK